MHEAARWCHPTTIKVLMNSYCRINIRNHDGDTPMDIAKKEGHSKIAAELSGLGTNITSFEESFGCEELRRLLFHDKLKFDDSKHDKLNFDDPKRKWIFDIETKTPVTPLTPLTPLSQTSVKAFHLESGWQEKLERANSGVMSKYEARRAEVEKSCQSKVDQIERKCLLTKRMLRNVHMAHDRSPSAPEQSFIFTVRSPSANRPDSL